jgi:hypothetical protein
VGQAYVITDLISALWRVSLMVALERSIEDGVDSNKCSMTLAPIISMCSLHVILIPKITPRYFR